MATPIQVGAAPSASLSAAAGRGADLLCRCLRLQSVQTFGRKVRARSQAGPHLSTGRRHHPSLSEPVSACCRPQKTAVAVAYAKPGKGLLKLNGETQISKHRGKRGNSSSITASGAGFRHMRGQLASTSGAGCSLEWSAPAGQLADWLGTAAVLQRKGQLIFAAQLQSAFAQQQLFGGVSDSGLCIVATGPGCIRTWVQHQQQLGRRTGRHTAACRVAPAAAVVWRQQRPQCASGHGMGTPLGAAAAAVPQAPHQQPREHCTHTAVRPGRVSVAWLERDLSRPARRLTPT